MAASRKLPRDVKSQWLGPNNDIYYSAAGLWEIAIKRGLQRTDFRIDIEVLMEALRASDFVWTLVAERQGRHPAETSGHNADIDLPLAA